MVFQRDPLSIEYDPVSRQVLERCVSQLWARIPVDIESRANDPVDSQGYTAHERAFKRSMYHVLKDPSEPFGGVYYNRGVGSTRVNWTYSLRVDPGKPRAQHQFMGVVRWGFRMRRFWCVVTPYGSAVAAMDGKPDAVKWKDNPALRSRGFQPGEVG